MYCHQNEARCRRIEIAETHLGVYKSSDKPPDVKEIAKPHLDLDLALQMSSSSEHAEVSRARSMFEVQIWAQYGNSDIANRLARDKQGPYGFSHLLDFLILVGMAELDLPACTLFHKELVDGHSRVNDLCSLALLPAVTWCGNGDARPARLESDIDKGVVPGFAGQLASKSPVRETGPMPPFRA